MAQDGTAIVKKIESLPSAVNSNEILSRPEKSLDLFHRFPKPGEFLKDIPRYALVTHDDILVIKRRTNTLAILEPGVYEIDVDLISPSTDYFTFIRISDYLLDWSLPAILDAKDQEDFIIGLSGTMILKVANVDLAAYNFIVTTRGLMDEFKQWLTDQINIIIKKEKPLLLSMDQPPGEEFFTRILQQELEEPLSFLGVELKGVQVTQTKMIRFHPKKPSASSKFIDQKEERSGKTQNKVLAEHSENIPSTKQQPVSKEKTILVLSMPSEIIVGFPRKLRVKFTTLETNLPQNVTIKAHSPSFLFHNSEKSITLNQASTEIEFEVVATRPGPATIHVSAYSTNGTRLATSRIETLAVRESHEVIGHLLKLYAISSMIMFLGMIVGMISIFWLRIEEVKIEALYLIVGVLLGLTLASLTAFAERRKR